MKSRLSMNITKREVKFNRVGRRKNGTLRGGTSDMKLSKFVTKMLHGIGCNYDSVIDNDHPQTCNESIQ